MRKGANLEHYEDFIIYRARELANVPADVDDFAQEGRLAAWQALERADDVRGRIAFVQQRITWRMIDYARKLYKVSEKEVVGFTPQQRNLLYGDYGDDYDEA
jgi:DNA-directed RNA polymerase specialized sigma subunit